MEFVEGTPGGRRVTNARQVRLGDVTPSGRLRLDALARYLQDVATDDAAAAAEVGADGAWVTRRVVFRIHDLPRYQDPIELETFCAGVGPRWVERRTDVTADGRLLVEAGAVWVFLDDDGRTAALPSWFGDFYGEALLRRVSGRLQLAAPQEGSPERSWPLRRSDFDVLDHVNNAIGLSAVEDELSRRPDRRRLQRVQIEYRGPIDPGDEPVLVSEWGDDALSCWLRVDGDVRVAAQVEW